VSAKCSTAAVDQLPRLIPSDVLVGYHLCYGTFPEWPMYEARDMGVLVRMANYAVANSGRPADWVHLTGLRYLRSEDERFFRPLADLEAGGGTRPVPLAWPVQRLYRPQRRLQHRGADAGQPDHGVRDRHHRGDRQEDQLRPEPGGEVSRPGLRSLSAWGTPDEPIPALANLP
jgi:hypothetical protein